MGSVVKFVALSECDDLYASMLSVNAYYMPIPDATRYILGAHAHLETEIPKGRWLLLVIRKMKAFDPERYMFEQTDFPAMARKVTYLLKARAEQRTKQLARGKLYPSQQDLKKE